MAKKLFALVCALSLCLLAACDGAQAGSSAGASAAAPAGSAADYRQVIEGARAAELNEVMLYDVVTSPDDARYDEVFAPTYGLVPEDMRRYAFANPGTLTLAYGVAVILPAAGKEQQITQQLNGFVDMRRSAMENYLRPQFEIAEAAIVKTVPTGEILMVMCEDAESVCAAMEQALAEG